jgi:hypothetical protein
MMRIVQPLNPRRVNPWIVEQAGEKCTAMEAIDIKLACHLCAMVDAR